MALATTLSSPFITGLPPDPPSKLRQSASIVFHNQTFPFQHNTVLHKIPTPRFTNICHGQMDGNSAGEESEDYPYHGIGEALFGDANDDDDVMVDYSTDDEDDTESSVDLLIRFLQAMCKKVSKRAKKASRSILPNAISYQLISFAVDGILLLASLSIVKALLEVVCTLGGTVFVAILLLRLIWAAISYFQSNGNSFNPSGNSFGTTYGQ